MQVVFCGILGHTRPGAHFRSPNPLRPDFFVGASFEDNYSRITHCLYGRAGNVHRRTAAAQTHNPVLQTCRTTEQTHNHRADANAAGSSPGEVGGGGAVRGHLLIWLRFEATGLGVAIFGQEIASPSIGPCPPSARSVWGQAM